MDPGDLVGERFLVERHVGSGGMGAVYQAHDDATGLKVALKVWNGIGDNAQRFEREAQLLADLQHPAIVRYVAHGTTPAGEMWLGMQWLEGIDLAEKLRTGGVTVQEAIAIVARAAEGLAAAHARGIVHRDIKPSNLFLVEGEPDQVKVLDFGVARESLDEPGRPATRTGLLVGTPEYMSPEQARGDRDVDARTDVFALGAVLWECLTGKPAFLAENVMALLAKVLLEEVPPLRRVRADLPEELEALLSRMLAKDKTARPAHAGEVAAALRKIASLPGIDRPAAAQVAPALTKGELRLVCIVLACERGKITDLEGTAPTLPSIDPDAPTGPLPKSLAAIGKSFGARVEPIGDGGVVLALSGRGTATDQAAHAARCALAVHDAAPKAAVALATGRGAIEQGGSLGALIDRAVDVLRVGLEPVSGRRSGAPAFLDETTAALLDERFELAVGAQGIELHGEREGAEGVRTLLGRPTPFVGRERELQMLLDTVHAAIGDATPHAILVTAPTGVGKSRLRAELVQRLREQGDAVEIWIGRGDPMRTSAPFGMIAPALRRSAGIVEGDPLGEKREKLRARVARHVPADDVARVSEFLGEMLGVPFDDETSVPLRAARRGPAGSSGGAGATLMGDQIRRAWEDFLSAEAAARPVLIVLEDLHHGDAPTTKLIDASLRSVRDRPWVVLALARPEVHQLFPKLWADRGRHEVHLGELGKRASERIARYMLGEQAGDRLVARVVERAGGNALFLEELIRAVTERGEAEIDGPLPETVLAIVQARLEALEPDARRLLRAGSVYGESFTEGGVRALLGDARATSPRMVREWLDELVEREVLARLTDERVRGETAYAFRSALVRDAAYATLPEEDRLLGHALAAEQLISTSEGDASLVAEHLERGGATAKAIEWYARAAQQARDAGDFAAVVGWAERGVACGATGDALGALRSMQAEALNAIGETASAQTSAAEATAALETGSDAWHFAIAELATAAGRLGDEEALASIVEAIHASDTAAGAAIDARLVSRSRAAFALFSVGAHDEAEALLDEVESIGAARIDADPVVAARVHAARTTRALWRGDVEALLRLSQAAAERFEQAGDLRSACSHLVNVGFACMELGAWSRAEEALVRAVEDANRLGLRSLGAAARHNLGWAIAAQGRLDEACAIEREAVELCRVVGDRRLEGGSRVYLATILCKLGDLESAEKEARSAIELGAQVPDVRAQAQATLARILIARERKDEALVAAREAHDTLESLGGLDEGESLVRLAWAEALLACGRDEEARSAIARAKERLEARAKTIADAALRESFLGAVPENAKTIELAIKVASGARR